jgi:Flp pilus assembly protein TadG
LRNSLVVGRRGSIAVWIAVMAPGLILMISMAVEVGAWASARVSTQRAADLAAIAGANYLATSAPRTAATQAANVAQLNGAAGIASPGWTMSPAGCGTPCTSVCRGTLTDNEITATVTYCGGFKSSSDPMMTISVSKTVTSYLPTVLNPATTRTISASGTAELVTTPGNSGTAAGTNCLIALSSTGTISGAGSTYWTMPTCTIRSNGTVSVTGGGGPLTTAGIYAVGAINIASGITTTGGQYPNSASIIDPFASYSPLQNALTTAAALTGVTNIVCGSVQGVIGTAGQYTGGNNCNGTNTLPNGGTCVTSSGVTCTLYPGNYGSFTISGGPYTFNFQPGLYLFKGLISLTNSSTSNGNGVTIVTAGAFTGQNSFNFNITAPTQSQVSTNGGVVGIALASSSTTTATISGNAAFNVAGVVYFPNAIFDASGSSCNSSTPCFGNNSTSCLQIVAKSIKTTGNSNFSSTCAAYGTSSTIARAMN